MPRVAEVNKLDEYLRGRGIVPDSKFADYQDYIEDQQLKVPTEVVYGDRVPVEGSVHLAMGRVISTQSKRKWFWNWRR